MKFGTGICGRTMLCYVMWGLRNWGKMKNRNEENFVSVEKKDILGLSLTTEDGRRNLMNLLIITGVDCDLVKPQGLFGNMAIP